MHVPSGYPMVAVSRLCTALPLSAAVRDLGNSRQGRCPLQRRPGNRFAAYQDRMCMQSDVQTPTTGQQCPLNVVNAENVAQLRS